MKIIDFVKWDSSSSDLLVWKFPTEDNLSTWTQLIVNESQEAFLVKGGVYEGPYGAGRHTLSTENIPIISKLIGLPFSGGQTPFSAEVWFVNKAINLDIKWGTPEPIQLQDPKFNMMVPVGAFGQYGVQISNGKRFLLKIVGTLKEFNTGSLAEYLRGALLTKIKTLIATSNINNKISVLDISTELVSLSETMKKSLSQDFDEYGLKLVQFNIHSISMSEKDPGVIALKEALARKGTMGILGTNYQQERSFDILETAAGNPGSLGQVMGAGIGVGIGAAIAPAIAAPFSQISEHLKPENISSLDTKNNNLLQQNDSEDRIKLLKDLAQLKDSGNLTDEEFQAEKRKILGL